jgi:hypothetical protein
MTKDHSGFVVAVVAQRIVDPLIFVIRGAFAEIRRAGEPVSGYNHRRFVKGD